MAGKASTHYPNGVKPNLGDTIVGVELGRASRAVYEWSSCPDCRVERWIQRAQGTKLCMRCAAVRRDLTGEKNPRWNGGVRRGNDGYRYITVPEDHPLISMAGRVFVHGKYRYYIGEHRLVMAQHLGRPLKPWELVHHKGIRYDPTSIENRSDNCIENLELMAYKKEHLPSMSVQKLVSSLQTRITLLEAELTRVESLLESGRDGVIHPPESTTP